MTDTRTIHTVPARTAPPRIVPAPTWTGVGATPHGPAQVPSAAVGARTAPGGGWWAWWRAGRGSVASEVTLLTPVLIMLLVFVAVVIHRGVDARLRLDDAAHHAARAASIERTSPAAAAAARSTAAATLSSGGVGCASLTVETATDRLRPGGVVTVTLTCTVDLADALILGVPGQAALTGSATEPVDTYRSVTATGAGGPS